MRNDLGIYERHAKLWWDSRSPWFRSLHGVNEFRTQLLRRWIKGPWNSLAIVDLGCGGGLLAETFAKEGAAVVGLDLGFHSLREARRHADERSLPVRYVHGDARHCPISGESADVVLLADILEHIGDYRRALAEAARIAKPGGRIYVNTISRTWKARWLAVGLAETLRLIPPGTHDPALFIRPSELEAVGLACGLRLTAIQGEAPRIFSTLRHWRVRLRRSTDVSVAYSALFVRERDASNMP